jgi:intracellular sulfur oxidation DsrE/DsrF family protein
MDKSTQFSDEFLNAFLDDELSDDDRQRLLDAMRDTPALDERLCQLQKTRDMLRLAYTPREIPGMSVDQPAPRWSGPGLAMTASIILLVGLSIGWFAHNQLLPGNSPVSIAQHMAVEPAVPSIDGTWRLVMHVNTTDPHVQHTLLDETEYLLESFAARQKKLEIEIVAYGEGLSMLRPDTTRFASRILELRKKFPNLSFAACGNTIRRMSQKEGQQVSLLPDTHIAASGIRQIIKREQEGWNYIRI